jgi:ABC-2 type transport system permease protein
VTGFGILVGKELLEAWRSLRLPVVAGVLLLSGLISPLLARFTPELIQAIGGDQLAGAIRLPEPTVVDSVAQLLKNVGQFGALAALLLAMGAVAGEVERGTAAFILVKPAGRAAFLTAKLLVIAVTLGLGACLATIAAAVYTALLFEPLGAAGWAGLAVTLWLSLLPYAAVTFLGSVVARSPVGAAAIGVGGLIVLAIASAIPSVAPYLPGGLAGLGGALALGRPAAELPGSVAVSLAILVGCAALSIWAFRRREL